jgi:hypothetical protein
MKAVKALNLKNMKETIVNYSETCDEFEKIWDTYYMMTCIGFISQDTWEKFFEQCAGWYVDEENACVRDERNCPEGVDSIVWKYNSERKYQA